MKYFYLLIALFICGCTDLGSLDYTEYPTIKVTGYFENWDEVRATSPNFIVTSASQAMPDTIQITGTQVLKNYLPAPRVRTGFTLFDQTPPYNVKLIVRDDIELDSVNVPVYNFTLNALEFPFAYTDQGTFRFDQMIYDRQQQPEIRVGETFRATRIDSTFTSLDR